MTFQFESSLGSTQLLQEFGAYLGICLIASSKGMLSSTFLKTSKISFSLSYFFDLEELTGKGGIVLKLEFIK